MTPSTLSATELASVLVAGGWDLQVDQANSPGVIGGFRTGTGYRDFMVMSETGTGEVLVGRWFAASNLTWIRMADGWQEMTYLLDTFPDEPAAPWLPAYAADLLTALQQRQSRSTTGSTVSPPAIAHPGEPDRHP